MDGSPKFMPHGMCFLWQPSVLLLQTTSDGLIALAYVLIAATLARLAWKRDDLPFKTIFWMFALFIVSCGATHMLAIWVIWHPDYWVEGAVKGVTAVSSLATAALILPLLPKALTLRSPRELEFVNAEMKKALNALREIIDTEREQKASPTFREGSLSTISHTLDELMSDLQIGSRENTGASPTSLFNLVVEASPSAMVLVDKEGRIALVNERTEKLFGYARHELLDQRIELLVPDRFQSYHPKLRDSFNSMPLAREMGAGRDLHARRNDGSEFPVEIGLNPIRTPGGVFTLAAITDLSERKAAEQERLARLDADRRAAQLEAERERKWSMTFQRAVLPIALPEVTGCTFDAIYEAGLGYAQVGGDWYDAVQLIDGRVLVAIGDVSGGGLEAAVVVGVIRQVMRGIAQLHANPGLILDTADRALCLEYPGIYASAWVGIVDLVTRTITYASAGHPPPVIVTRDGTVRELSDPTTLLIGLREGHRGQPQTVQIGPDDTLVLFTDGVIEASRDVIGGISLVHTAASTSITATGNITAASIWHNVIPDGSADDAAILVVRTDCSEAERHMKRWRFDVRDRNESSAVRGKLIETLGQLHFTSDDCAGAELVFGELIGNVVRHAEQTRRLDVVLDHRGPHNILHVLDRGTGFQHIGRLPNDPYAENGRGLFLIGALTVDFTVSERPEGGSHARAVLRGGSRSMRTGRTTRQMAEMN